MWQRVALICVGTALAAAALLAMRAGEPALTPATTATPTPKATGALITPRAQPPVLALPAGITDVELSAFPDWLANEPPPASLRAVVAIRGTMGIASVEGVTVVNWTEHGLSYRLVSAGRTVPELVVLADALR